MANPTTRGWRASCLRSLSHPGAATSASGPPPPAQSTAKCAEGLFFSGGRSAKLASPSIPGPLPSRKLTDSRYGAETLPDQTIIVDHCGGVLGVGQMPESRQRSVPSREEKKSIAASTRRQTQHEAGEASDDVVASAFHEAMAHPFVPGGTGGTWTAYVATCMRRSAPIAACSQAIPARQAVAATPSCGMRSSEHLRVRAQRRRLSQRHRRAPCIG